MRKQLDRSVAWWMLSLLVTVGLVSTGGCTPTEKPETEGATPAASSGEATSGEGTSGAGSGDESAASGGNAMITLPEGTELVLTPTNTKIQFVGTHTGDDPKPRVGVFEEFTGTAQWNADRSAIEGVEVEIQTGSLVTEFDKLTTHLKSEDFFDVNAYPTAVFKTTQIEPAADDASKWTLTGELTLMGATQEVTFPVQVQLENGQFRLEGNLVIDRTAFGMDKLTDGVNKEVELTVVIGEPSALPGN